MTLESLSKFIDAHRLVVFGMFLILMAFAISIGKIGRGKDK